jgi:hypothetical protein
VKIHLILSDDWELRGDGSGNMHAIQFDTINKLTKIYDDYGLKGSFNVELMQQFYHYKFSDKFPELRKIYNEWEDIVKDNFSRGHDMQLHLHPQWIDADYKDGKWILTSDWDITNHPRDTVDKLIKKGIAYLENLLKPINPDYKCVSYRGGSWAIAPSEHMMQLLADNEIVFDMSIVDGLVSTRPVKIDYRNLEEPFLPYYPQMNDSRKVNNEKSPIIVVPTHSFISRNKLLPLIIQKLRGKNILEPFLKKFDFYLSPRALHIKNAGYNLDEYHHGGNEEDKKKDPKFGERVFSLFEKTSRISDIAHLDYPMFKKMIKDIRQKSAATGWEFVPVLIENHTKNIGNFASIEKFAKYIAEAVDIEVITHSQLAKNLKNGMYPIRYKTNDN